MGCIGLKLHTKAVSCRCVAPQTGNVTTSMVTDNLKIFKSDHLHSSGDASSTELESNRVVDPLVHEVHLEDSIRIVRLSQRLCLHHCVPSIPHLILLLDHWLVGLESNSLGASCQWYIVSTINNC